LDLISEIVVVVAFGLEVDGGYVDVFAVVLDSKVRFSICAMGGGESILEGEYACNQDCGTEKTLCRFVEPLT
jgi:hypothetical protein